MTWKKERNCGIVELYIRKFITSLFYFRGYRKLYPHKPYYTPGAVHFLEGFLKPHHRVFEWGSGTGSRWYAERVCEYVAIEHDPTWIDITSKQLQESKVQSANLVYSPDPDTYPAEIDRYPDGHFDVISIDGRQRVQCLPHALPKLADSGILIFDDSQRPRYQSAKVLLKDWFARPFDFGLQQTTLFSRRKTVLED